MHQVKIFKGVETEVAQLEQQINDWIRHSGARVVSITGNIAPQTGELPEEARPTKAAYGPSDVLVIVLWEQPLGD